MRRDSTWFRLSAINKGFDRLPWEPLQLLEGFAISKQAPTSSVVCAPMTRSLGRLQIARGRREYVPSSPATGACIGFCPPKSPLTKSAIVSDQLNGTVDRCCSWRNAAREVLLEGSRLGTDVLDSASTNVEGQAGELSWGSTMEPYSTIRHKSDWACLELQRDCCKSGAFCESSLRTCRRP